METKERRKLQELVRERKAFAFSNFKPCQIRALAMDFPTLEHAYQACKTLDEKVRLKIQRAKTAGEAKKIGNIVTLRPGWEKIRISVMANLLRQKFQSGGKFAEQLLATENEVIVEWNMWHDRFWGRCVCERCLGEGQNMLGVLLMERRRALQEEAKQLKGVR